MEKVFVAEIGNESIVINTFVDLDTANPKLLGQGISYTTVHHGDIEAGLKSAVQDLEKEIGTVGSLDEITIYASSLVLPHRLEKHKVPSYLKNKLMPTSEAILRAAQVIYEEVGEVLVIDVSPVSTNVYSIIEDMSQETMAEDLNVINNTLPLVKLIGEKKVMEHYGSEWEKLNTINPKTPKEMIFRAELTAAAIGFAVRRHTKSLDNKKDVNFNKIRWIVGTGVGLTQFPNALEIFQESIEKIRDRLFEDRKEIAILLDKDSILTSLGVLPEAYRKATWQLMRESFGLEN
ncbi:glutamate mutase L [Desulfosporosinus meridiei]|uniref:Actin-like ATPase involved in cell morphogenesis n=1 Tax=Desulfosporosinus meridiei (strain ATCC BAA-275 / DSM 13257 / KCTC 12902 / NCIMB 13706 / S10) TaxID=768704 RepID=J7IS37_DESMD|nr:glutamate mutase L [Desulfosporosinus meridiei]AFQ44687.1 hypothetical protein Desmer_2780 [Desulfosporosinus meridiei DSM 13257]